MRTTVALLFLLALPLRAGIDFTPPVADAHTSVDIVVHGYGAASPSLKGLEVSGHTVIVRMQPATSGIAASFSWSVTAHAGVLAPGVYDVVTDYDGVRDEHATLIVRDDAMVASRHALPATGGDIGLYYDCCDVLKTVSIDGGPPLPVDWIVVHVPAHAPGTVDVKATTLSGKTVTARALLTFYDPAAPPDPVLFEPILFPIAFSGPGAFGTQWSTENMILGTARFFAALPCSGNCKDDGHGQALAPAGAAGLLLWAERGSANNVWLSSRVRETTRGTVTPVPVFRERDLRNSDVGFFTVPHPPDSRATLRVWSLSALNRLQVGVWAISPKTVNGGPPMLTAAMTRTEPNGPFFAAVDITAALEEADDGVSPITVRVIAGDGDVFNSRLWALLSITENASQRVTVIAPQ